METFNDFKVWNSKINKILNFSVGMTTQNERISYRKNFFVIQEHFCILKKEAIRISLQIRKKILVKYKYRLPIWLGIPKQNNS